MQADGASTPADPPLPAVPELYEELRRRILDGSMRPGAPVSQVRLARELGVHRTPLREALRMLQREGLIDAEPNRRVRIATISSEEIEDLYARRILLEVLAVRVGTPRFRPADLAKMDAALEAMEAHSSPAEIEGWDRAHRELHDLFSSQAEPRLAAEIAEAYDHASRYRRVLTRDASPQDFDRAGHEHRAIVEGLPGPRPRSRRTRRRPPPRSRLLRPADGDRPGLRRRRGARGAADHPRRLGRARRDPGLAPLTRNRPRSAPQGLRRMSRAYQTSPPRSASGSSPASSPPGCGFPPRAASRPSRGLGVRPFARRCGSSNTPASSGAPAHARWWSPRGPKSVQLR